MAEELATRKEAGIVEFEVNGESVKLSNNMIRKYLVNGGGNVTDQEVMMFLSLCRYQHLNPFTRDCYLIKYGNSQPATMVTSKDVFTRRASHNPNYKGKKAGIIVLKESGEIEEREGSFTIPGEKIVGGWAKIYIKGRETPEYAAVAFEEYAGRKNDGTLNSNWAKKPATMIRKVAVVHALREAFPDDFQGMYVQEEFPEVSDVKLPENEISQDSVNDAPIAPPPDIFADDDVIDVEEAVPDDSE